MSPVLFYMYTAVLAKINSVGLGRVLTFANGITEYHTGKKYATIMH